MSMAIEEVDTFYGLAEIRVAERATQAKLMDTGEMPQE